MARMVKPTGWGKKIRNDVGVLPDRRACLHCGVDFQPPRHSNRRTCSNECLHDLRVKQRASQPQAKRRAEPMRDLKRTCECGEPIIRRNATAKRCIDCAAKRVGLKKRGRPRKSADV